MSQAPFFSLFSFFFSLTFSVSFYYFYYYLLKPRCHHARQAALRDDCGCGGHAGGRTRARGQLHTEPRGDSCAQGVEEWVGGDSIEERTRKLRIGGREMGDGYEKEKGGFPYDIA